MGLNLLKARRCLDDFDFSTLFTEELGWSKPVSMKPLSMTTGELSFTRTEIANLGEVFVFEIIVEQGDIPDSKTRASIYKVISNSSLENLLIFIDKRRFKSLWYWVKRQDGESFSREHIYHRGQPGDLFLGKLNAMLFDFKDHANEKCFHVEEVTLQLKQTLDGEKVTKKFYTEFQEIRLEFLGLIRRIDNERDRGRYASVILTRLMFIYFLQWKFFIDNGNISYLQDKLKAMKEKGENLYYEKFLKLLFFEGFAKPEERRSKEARELLGKIKYLNGGLFLPHPVELRCPGIAIPDIAFEKLFSLFERYSWNLNDTPEGKDDEINPDVLGYIFEKYINQKAFGAYYTRPEITEYLCERTIHKLILDRVNSAAIIGFPVKRNFTDIGDLIIKLDSRICWELIDRILPNIRILDPACGSGAFLVSAMKTLINIYAMVIGTIMFLPDKKLSGWLKDIENNHSSINYYIKKNIITENLYGVDIMEEAVEIAKLRLFLALVASAVNVDDLEPLPNIDFNIIPGNSLIGLMRVDDKKFESHFQGNLFQKSYQHIVAEKDWLVAIYRHTSLYSEDLQSLRDDIDHFRNVAIPGLNSMLCDDFEFLNIKYEQAGWDKKKNTVGKPVKRKVIEEDVEKLKPFHWGFEFNEIINTHEGFDVIITSPPWEIFKPNVKEFFEEHSDLVTKKKMTIKDFEKEQANLLKDTEIRKAWLEYLSGYPHLSAFFRTSPQYLNQISVVNGKKAGTDINLYKLFVEQCFNLLRKGGCCGIVIPSGIYTDLGSKQLREMLFSQTSITGLFCFENRKGIFENVHKSFKFVVLTFEKGGKTESFPTAFMRHEVSDLDRFPKDGAIDISIDLIHRLSPDSLSIMEFKESIDIKIAEKMLKFPRLGEELPGKWNLVLGNEFHMIGDSLIFKTELKEGYLPLYEGKMIWQFDHKFGEARYWISEKEGRKSILSKESDNGQILGYQKYRLGYRSIASSTNDRTMIATILPPNVFFGHSINASHTNIEPKYLILLAAILNSYVFDYSIRSTVSSNLTIFFIYQLPVPRLTEEDVFFGTIVNRAARLICTTPEFDELAKEVGLTGHKDGAVDPAERAKLRAEIDGLIAHLYGLTEEEFKHILTTFPIVSETVKTAAFDEYRRLAPNLANQEITKLLKIGEGSHIEFKSTARWNLNQNRTDKDMEKEIIKTVAAFLNAEGGTLLIGVADEGVILGLKHDYKTLGKKQDKDGFENWLTTCLLETFGKDFSPYIHIEFHSVEWKEICKVEVKAAPKPAYVKDGNLENLIIRTGNSSRTLTTREAVEYSKTKWGQ